MTTKPKRPPSVWISQVILVIFSVIQVAGLGSLISVLSEGGLPSSISPVVVFASLGVSIVFLILQVAAFSGLSKRKSWARWLTVGLFSLMVVGMVLQVFSTMGAENVSGAYRTGQMAGSMLFIIPFAYLVFRLATGDPAHDFFNSPEDPEEMFGPPPPPTFAE